MDKELNLRTKYILDFFFIIFNMFMLIIIGLYIPIMGILFVPISIVLLYLRYNKIIAISSIIISVIIPSIIFSSFLSLTFGVTYIVIGIILTICIKKNIKFVNSFCTLVVAMFISYFTNLVIIIYVVNKSNFWNFAQDIIKNFNEAVKTYSYLGVNTSSNQYVESINKIMIPQNILSALPTIIIIFSIITAFLIYFIAEKILSKNNYKMNKIISFDRWYLKPKIGAILIVITCLFMFLYSKNVFIAEYIYKTTYSLLQFLVFIMGLSIINYFLKNKMKFNNKICIGISILILIFPLSNILIVLGLVDLISDIRGIDPNSLGIFLRKKYCHNS